MSPTGQEVQSTTNNDSPEHAALMQSIIEISSLVKRKKAKQIPYEKKLTRT